MHCLTELEERLQNDPWGHTRRTLLDALDQAVTNISRQQRQPLPADLFARLDRQRLSCLATMQVIEQIWALQHNRPLSSS